MKSKKLIKIQMMGMALILAMGVSGCGSREDASNKGAYEYKADNTLAEVSEETAVSVEVEEQVNTEEQVKEQVIPDYGFDENFEIKPGETLHVGREGISIRLDKLIKDEYGVSFYYTLSIDDKDYVGDGFYGYYVEPSVYQAVFTENRVRCIEANEDKSMILQITETTKIKEPLILSGKAEDEYITTQPEYVEKGNTILFLDEGVKVYGNTMELIETIFMLAEKETGLKLENNSVYADSRSSGPAWLFADAFAGVDPASEKYHIYVVPEEKCSPCAPVYSMVINPIDLEIAAGEGMVILHEHIHNLHTANGVGMDRTMDEGYATYMTGRISEKDEVIPFNFDARLNYSGYDKTITKENAEAEFLVIEDPDWEEYQYGYRFMTYLFEEYGENIFRDILDTASKSTNDSFVDTANMPPHIKKHTSETVFEDFAEWLAKNQSKFEFE